MARAGSRIKEALKWVRDLLDESVLHSGRPRTRLHRFVHFWALVWRSFTRNRCPMRATALAYGTLLALIPMLAVAVSVTSSFLKKEGEDRIDDFIIKMVTSFTGAPDHPGAGNPVLSNNTNSARLPADADTSPAPGSGLPGGLSYSVAPGLGATNEPANTNGSSSYVQSQEVVQARRAAAKKIHDFIQNTRSEALGLTGSVLLIFAGISLLTQIETTFNDIWGAHRGRSWPMRVVLYWGVLSLAPLLLIVALGLATGRHFEWTRRVLAATPVFGH